MKAMLFAAGLGMRLRPLTDALPKPLAPIAGRPVVEYQLDALAEAGVTDVMINLHYLPHLIQQRLGDGRAWGMTLHYSSETELLGTGGGFRQVRRFFEHEERFLAVNADVLHRIALGEAIGCNARSGAAATMIVCSHPGTAGIGWIGLDATGAVRRVPDMPDPGGLTRKMFTGLQVLTPEIFGHLPESRPCCILRAGYRGLVESGAHVDVFETEPQASRDIGTLEDYLTANRDARSRTPV
jgi:NDP-sugar pyrophosphorylase family protein